MPDVRLVQQPSAPLYDVVIDWNLLSDGTLDDTQALATAVIVALGTDALADVSDILPDPDSSDRAGWWGDLDADTIWGAWPIGCKLWLLKRDKIVGADAQQGSTLVRVENYIRDAIMPFISGRVASQMEVKAVRVGQERIDALVRIYRGPQTAIELRYQILWADITPQSPVGPYYSP